MKKFVAAMLVAMMAVLMTAGAMAQGSVSLEQAKQTALERAGVKAGEVRFNKAHQDWDDGRQEYDVKFYVGRTEYKCEIDMATGMVTDFDIDFD